MKLFFANSLLLLDSLGGVWYTKGGGGEDNRAAEVETRKQCTDVTEYVKERRLRQDLVVLENKLYHLFSKLNLLVLRMVHMVNMTKFRGPPCKRSVSHDIFTCLRDVLQG